MNSCTVKTPSENAVSSLQLAGQSSVVTQSPLRQCSYEPCTRQKPIVGKQNGPGFHFLSAPRSESGSKIWLRVLAARPGCRMLQLFSLANCRRTQGREVDQASGESRGRGPVCWVPLARCSREPTFKTTRANAAPPHRRAKIWVLKFSFSFFLFFE